jgi:ATP-dependent Lon protease
MDLHNVGCVATITAVKREYEKLSIIVRGLERIRIIRTDRSGPSFVAAVEYVRDPTDIDQLLLQKAKYLRDEAHALLSALPGLRSNAALTIERIEHPGRFADVLLANLALPTEEQQRALETFDLVQRIDIAIAQVRRVLRMSTLSG